MSKTNENFDGLGQYVSANGLEIYCEEFGSGEPLVLLHGGAGTSHMWRPFLPLFGEQFRVVMPDLRGHGRTVNTSSDLSYRLLAEDIADLIRALGLSKPLIFGYSDGGQIALEIGMRYPNLSAALVVGAASYQFSEDYFNSLKAMGIDGPGVVNFGGLPEQWISHLKEGHPRTDDPDYWQKLLKALSVMWSTPLDYSAEDFQEITDPTLIFMGDRDGMVPLKDAVEMYHLIPNAELAILPNANHRTAMVEDGLFLRIVLDFLKRHGSETLP